MNIVKNISLSRTCSLLAGVSIVLGVFAPFSVFADAPIYHVAVTSQSFGALSITLGGTTSATNFAGQFSAQHVHIDWGDASSSDPVIPNTLTQSGNDFSGTWGPIIHHYSSTGPQTIIVAICHSKCSGHEGADSTVTLNVIIPPAILTVVKNVNNGIAGTATPASFTMHVTNTGGTSFSATTSPGSSSGVVFALPDGASYIVTETGPSGYVESDSVACSGTVHTGDHPSCTVTNTFTDKGTLHVVKHVVNDNGGTANAANFNLHVKNVAGFDVDGSPAVGSETGTDYTLPAGTYVVTETDGPSAGYTQSYSGACSIVGFAAVVNGQTKTCTITNDDIAPSLTLQKVVSNIFGGTAQAAEWTLHAIGTLNPATNLSGTTPVHSISNFKADTYTLSETGGPDTYNAGAWQCVGGSQEGSTISLALGQSATCTITKYT
jgi:hypothetical protein